MRATSRRRRSSPIERPRFHCGLALARPLDVSRREHHRGMRNFHRRCGRVELWRGGGGEGVIEHNRERGTVAALWGGSRPSGLPSAGDAPRARFARARRSCSHMEISLPPLRGYRPAERRCVYASTSG